MRMPAMRNVIIGVWSAPMLLAALAWGVLVQAGEGKKEVVHSFKFTSIAKVEMDVEGKKQQVRGDVEIRYTWRRSGRERTLSLDGIGTKVSGDGIAPSDSYMSRAKVINTYKGKLK